MSIFNFLRSMIGAKPTEEAQPKPAMPKVNASTDKFKALCDKYNAEPDAKEKGEIMGDIMRMLPGTLLLATMCYEGENPTNVVSEKERVLRISPGAKQLYGRNQASVMNGNPGYRPAIKSDRRRIHLHTLVNNKTKETWMPVFTDFTKLLPVFGQQYRVTMLTFAEAKEMAASCSGIVINPGKGSAIHIGKEQLKSMG